ncbi:hypothetical protein V490_07594 [Pseudogymnoascus sp. VKM F-3557]|nr:hypothetical protein V490_07594 [Pseudogymnoascus sp. VKM F-3557]
MGYLPEVCATFGSRKEWKHLAWKDTMETPDGNGQEQGGDMATDHTSSDSKKSTTAVKTSNATSQNPELPRVSHGNRKPGTVTWESHYGVGRYGLGPRLPVGGGTQGDKAKESAGPTPAKADVVENEARNSNKGPTQSCPINEELPSTTALSVPGGNDAAHEPGDTPLEPPVTKEVLAELEIAMVISNPKFRHDFNFGCDIAYVPKENKQKPDDFWHILRHEISELYSNREAFIAKHPGNTWTLPILMKTIGEILAALLPQRDSSVIKETLDVDLLMQQVTKGDLNLEQLADWFSETLRKHCAPMRDCAIFEMAKKLTVGFHCIDVANLVDGLERLLTTIESMRLDVTNHQINQLTLIQGFVSFQQTKILKIISTGAIDIYGSYAWFDAYRIPDTIPALSREGAIWKFFRAVVDLLRHHSREEPIPDTLELDRERIEDLRTRLLNVVNMNVCMNLFKEVDEMIISPKRPASEGRIHTSPGVQSNVDMNARNRRYSYVRSALRAIADDYSNSDVDPCSPSSPLDFDHWKVAAPALTLEILRNANKPLSVPYLEKKLIARLSNPSDEYFRRCERAVFGRLGEHIQEHVTAWQLLDGLALYKVAPVCPNGCKIHGKPKELEHLDEMARRIAHVGILHWKVWGEIVYSKNPNEHPDHLS